MTSAIAEQPTLFNTDTKDLNANWIDEGAILRVPVDPLQYHAYQLQETIQLLKGQAKTNPAQFNSKNLVDLLNEFKKTCEEINKQLAGGNRSEVLDETGVAKTAGSQAQSDGEIEPISMDS